MKKLPRVTAVARPVLPHRIRRHRALFISDVHLGTRGCKAEMLCEFLAHNDCQTLFLVGDIVDGWRLRRRWYWSDAHSDVIHEILRKVQSGTRVILVPGNHDEVLRPYCGLTLGGVELEDEAWHETADGRRILVLHGDRFDGVVTYARWLAMLGDWAYTVALKLNSALNAARRALNLPYWSLSAYLKFKVKNAASFIADFEQTVAREARLRGADGVVCGHIHHAEIKIIDGVLYCNDGDWVESCTALAEDMRGRLEILRWTPLAREKRSELAVVSASIPPSHAFA